MKRTEWASDGYLKVWAMMFRIGTYLLVGSSAAYSQTDTCEMAVPLAGAGTYAFDNTSALVDGPSHAACAEFGQANIDADVWYCWESDCNDIVNIKTCNETGVDTKIAVYDGCTCPPGDANLLDCNDDTCNLQSEVNFSTQSGQSYLIRIGSSPGTLGGTGQFIITCEVPDSDFCDGAVSINGDGPFLFDTSAATQDGPDHPNCNYGARPGIGHDIWYTWTATCDGEAVVETCGLTSVDTKIAVYDSAVCPVTDANLLACDDDACNLQSRVPFSVHQGSEYLIRVGTNPGATGGIGSFSISCNLVKDGADNCSSALPIAGSGTFAFDNMLANRDGPAHAECLPYNLDQIDHDIWYCWSSDVQGIASINTCGNTSVDTRVAVYEGCSCMNSDVNLLACDDDACGLQSNAMFDAHVGQQYMIRIGTHPDAIGGTGSFSIKYSPAVPTISFWGIVILSLFMLTLGTLLLGNESNNFHT